MSPTFRSLSNPNYRRYAAGGVVSNTGTWMQRVAQDWLVLQLTANSGTAIGITTGLQFLPFLLFAPFAGLVADRMSKRRLLQLTNIGMALPAAVLGLLTVTGTVQIWHVYVLAFVLGTAAAFDAPARQSFVSEIVEPDDLTNAVGLNSASLQRGPDRRPRARRPADRGVRRGCRRHRMGDPAQRRVVRRTGRRAARDGPQPPRQPGAVPAHAGGHPRGRRLRPQAPRPVADPRHRRLHRHVRAELPDDVRADGDRGVRASGPTEYGLLGTFMAVGSLAGALVAARRERVRHRLVVGAALAFGAIEVVAGLAPSYVVFAAIAPLLGLTALTMITSANAFMQLHTEPGMRGRVMALYMMIFMGGTPIGSPVIGWVGETFGARWTLIGGGSLTMLGVAASAALYLAHQRDPRRVLTPA